MATSILNGTDTKVTKKSIFMVHYTQVKVLEGFNIREDLGDIETLAKQIEACHEVKKPLRGYKEKGKDLWVITDGHRRVAALKLLRSKNKCLNVRLPFMVEPKGYTDLDRTLDMFTLNDGKSLTYLEEAKLYQRLKQTFQLNNSEIAKKVGKSSMHVGNSLLILDAPQELQDYIAQKVVSATTVLSHIKKDKGGIVTLGLIEKAIEVKKELGEIEIVISNKHLKEVKAKEEKGVEVKEDLRTIKGVNSSSKELDLGPILSAISSLGVGQDIVSQTGTKVLEMVLAYAQGHLSKGEFSQGILNDLS